MNNDLISREALKDITYINKGNFNTVEGIREWIDNAPAVGITEEQAINKLHETGWLPNHDKEMTTRPQGEWIDYSETDGYVECPFCGSLTNCEGNKEELHFCWNCGAEMRKES